MIFIQTIFNIKNGFVFYLNIKINMSSLGKFFLFLSCCKNTNTVNVPENIENPLKDEIDKDSREIPIDLNLKDIPSFIPQLEEGRVLKIYDGDTITIAAKPKNVIGGPYKYSIRILGIDTPEIKPKIPRGVEEDSPEYISYLAEKEVAKIARDQLVFIYKNMVRLENVKPDKYGGRYLADVYYDDIKISDWLIKKRLAVEYDGGTKNPPSNWKDFYENNV